MVVLFLLNSVFTQPYKRYVIRYNVLLISYPETKKNQKSEQKGMFSFLYDELEHRPS